MVMRTSDRAIAMGIDGKPAPLPTSHNVAFCGMAMLPRMLSAKCLIYTSLRSVIAVRLYLAFSSVKKR